MDLLVVLPNIFIDEFPIPSIFYPFIYRFIFLSFEELKIFLYVFQNSK